MNKWKRNGILGAILFVVFCGSILYIYHRETKPVTLQFAMYAGSQWNVPNDDYYKIIDETIAEYEKKYPNVKVKYTSGILKDDYSEWLSEQALKGKTPDVMMVLSEDTSTFASIGLLLNLDQIIKSDDKFDKSKYYASAYADGEYEGSQYALPYESVPTMMFINKTLLKKEGIQIPKGDWSWNEFYDICKKVTKDTDGDGLIDQFGVYDYSWKNSVVTNGGELFSKDGSSSNLTNTNVKEAIKFTSKINEISGNQKATSNDFDTGKVAFRPMTFAEYKTYKPYPWRLKKYSKFDWDCIKLPAGSNGKNISEVESLVMGIGNSTKYQKEAWNFLKMLTYNQKTQQKILRDAQGISPLKEVNQSKATEKILQKEVSQDGSVKLSLLNEIMEQAVIEPKFKNYYTVYQEMDQEIQYILNSQGDIDDGLLRLKQEVDQSLNE
ncbi:MAG: sugar ABC transporter substrate-binding protein [Anaerostipes sp.]|nr:sugar ABC transporter substrate-binding protein [Anaerostipes sp.]